MLTVFGTHPTVMNVQSAQLQGGSRRHLGFARRAMRMPLASLHEGNAANKAILSGPAILLAPYISQVQQGTTIQV